MRGVLFVFLDGVGIGSDDPSLNPFLCARLPTLQALLDGAIPTHRLLRVDGPTAVAFPLDATLQMPGRPQSGTGQTALLSGHNAARIFGRHFGPWVPVALRPLLERENLLVRASERGIPAAFANAYPKNWSQRGGRRPAAPPLAARSAGLLTRHEDALASGQAVSSEIVNDGWRAHLGPADLPVVTPGEAGRNLARVAASVRLTFYAHYGTDHAGHRGGRDGAVAALEQVDAFLGGVLAELPDDTLLLVTSDHGNIEELGGAHTRNPALAILSGSGARERSQELHSLTDVAPAVLRWLS